MSIKLFTTGFVLVVAALASGCASYRTSSNIEPAVASTTSTATATPTQPSQVLLAENNMPGRNFKELGPIEVTVKKLTIFHKDPTQEQANEALTERARALGADAVINIVYKSGIGFTTWGYIEAKGVAVKLLR